MNAAKPAIKARHSATLMGMYSKWKHKDPKITAKIPALP